MSEYNLFAGVNSDYEFPPEVRQALINSLNIRNVGAPMSTADRNALDTNSLDPGYFIFNTQKQGFQIWRADFEEWHDGLETPGSQKWWPGISIPAGWKKHDGSSLPRSTYAALFAAIGTTYGGADTPTHFKLPLTLGRTMIDVNTAHPLGHQGGAERVGLTPGQMPKHHATGDVDGTYMEHQHDGTTHVTGNHSHGYWWITDGVTNTVNDGGNAKYNASRTFIPTGDAGDHAHTFWTNLSGQWHYHTFTSNLMGNDETHENMQPYHAGHFIIKY